MCCQGQALSSTSHWGLQRCQRCRGVPWFEVGSVRDSLQGRPAVPCADSCIISLLQWRQRCFSWQSHYWPVARQLCLCLHAGF